MQSRKRKHKWFYTLSLWLVCVTLLNAFVPGLAAQAANGNGVSPEGQAFVIEASAEPNPVKAGQRAELTLKVSPAVSKEAAVRVQVKSQVGEVVAQLQYPKEAFTAGLQRTYPFAWNVPGSLRFGDYDVNVEVTSKDRTVTYASDPKAAVLQVKPPIDMPESRSSAIYKTAAYPVPATVAVKTNSNMTLMAQVESSENTAVRVDLEVYDSHGAKVLSSFIDNQVLQANQKYSFPFAWTVPEKAKTGTYSVHVGVSKPGGGERYEWNATAGSFEVSHKYNVPGDTVAPAAPTGITAEAGDGIIKLHWAKATEADAAGYKIYVTSDDNGWSAEYVVGLSDTYTVAGLMNGTPYRFAVSAVDYAGNVSAQSALASGSPVDRTPPAVPEGLTATAGDASVALSWTSNAETDLAGYRLFTSTDGGASWDAGVLIGTETSFTRNQLENDKTYTFAITAMDTSNNESLKSDTASATPKDMTTPAIPEGLSAEAGLGKVTLRWNVASAGTDVQGYNVYVSTDGGIHWLAPVYAGLVAEYAVTGLADDGTLYTFAVSAISARGNESGKSAAVTAKPVVSDADRTPPSVPVINMGLPQANGVVLMWSQSPEPDLAGYKIYKSLDGGSTWDSGYAVGMAPMYFYTGLKGGVPYTFAIASVDQSGNESAKSGTLTATPIAGPDRTPPIVPKGVTAIAGNKSAFVTWDAVTDEDLQNYYVYVTNQTTHGFMRLDAGKSTSYQVSNLTNGVVYAIQVSAADSSGNESSRSLGVNITPAGADVIPPAVPSGLRITDVRNGMLSLAWTESPDMDKDHYNVYLSTDNGTTWGAPQIARTAAFLASGLTNGKRYTFAVTTVDTSDNESGKSLPVNGMPSAYTVPQGLIASPGDGEVKLGWDPINATDLKAYRVYMSRDGGLTWNTGNNAGTTTHYTAQGLENDQSYMFAVTAVRADGAESNRSLPVTAKPSAVLAPPDPSSVAPSLPNTNNVTFKDSVSFLYEGSNPVQFGVLPGALRPEQVSVITGHVSDTAGMPISGVKITVLNHSDIGITATRADGVFDIAINGGNGVTLQFEKDGYMTVQRKAPADWNEFLNLPEVIMTPFDSKVSEIDLTRASGVQMAESSVVTDQDGSRQATLAFLPGTTATMTLPNGTTQQLNQLHVRATEYTVGEKGEQAMPGEIPASVAYTYAVELSADEAVAAGASKLTFNQPVYVYVDNFLNFQTGSIIPSGYYNLQQGAWEAETDGIVMQIIGVSGGLADIDLSGDGSAESEERLADYGFTSEERTALAARYETGKTLWRVPANHFSPYDYNQNGLARPDPRLMPPSDPISEPGKGTGDGKPDPCNQKGSIIGCYHQTLGQSIPITGTPLTLDYKSDLTPGYTTRGEIEVPVTDGRPLSDKLLMATVRVTVAGVTMEQTYAVSSMTKDLKAKFVWDGKDRYGRKLVGEHPYKAIVMYHYPTQMYIGLPPFASGGGSGSGSGSSGSGKSFGNTITIGAAGYFRQGRDSGTLNREYEGYLTSPQNPYEETGIAGWKLSSQDLLLDLDQGSAVAEMNGREQDITIPANPGNVVGPDGSYYVKKGIDLYRIRPDGNGAEQVGTLRADTDQLIAYGADGTMYAKDSTTQNVYRKYAWDSTWVLFAGNGTPRPLGTNAYYPDGTDAKSINWSIQFQDYEVGPEGKLYFIDNGVLYRVDANGIMFNYEIADQTSRDDNYLGQGVGEGLSSKENIGKVYAVEIGKDGTLYVLQAHSIAPCKIGCGSKAIVVSRIKAISPSGEIRTIAGAPFAPNFESENQNTAYNLSDGVKATDAYFYTLGFERDEEGNITFAEYNGSHMNQTFYQIDKAGYIRNFDSFGLDKMKHLVSVADEKNPEYVNLQLLQAGPDDRVYFFAQTRGNLSMVMYTGTRKGASGGTYTIPDNSGMYAGVFDLENGRLLRTVSTLTGQTHFTYNYDTAGRLVAIRDFNDHTITIQRDADGTPSAIVNPYGQVTLLTVEDGQLKQVTNPAGDSYKMEYDASGLMRTFTDPESNTKKYEYDAKGLLTRAETPRQGVKTLDRKPLVGGHEVSVTDPDGNTTVYTYLNQSGMTTMRVTNADGAVMTVNDYPLLTEKSYPDGTTAYIEYAVDPQFGQLYASKTRTFMPDGEQISQTVTRDVKFADANDPFSITNITTTTDLDGAVQKQQYDAATRTVTLTSAEGHRVQIVMDEWDRTIRQEEPGTGIAPVLYSYDEQGRLLKIEQGDIFVAYTYNELGLVDTVTNSAEDVKTYAYDAANRLIRVTTAGQKTYQFGYDKNGNQTSMTLPNGEVYRQSFNADGDLEGIKVGDESTGLVINRTLASNKDVSTLWSGRTVDYTFEGSNLTEINDTDLLRTMTFAPDEKLGRFTSVNSVTTNEYADEQNITFEYDGMNIIAMTFDGDAQGSFSYTNNEYGFLTGVESTVNSSKGTFTKSEQIAYDDDFGVTKLGSFTYGYNGPNGRLDNLDDGNMHVAYAYDNRGRIESLTYLVGGSQVFRVSYAYDKRNYVTTRTVVKAGSTEQFVYSYDKDGQLTDVARTVNGVAGDSEHYEYDANKNRTLREVDGSASSSNQYGDSSVLQHVGDVAYSFDADGFLTQRGNDTFHYGPRGELLVAHANGDDIHYTYDGMGRLVAREDGQGKTQYLYGNRYFPKSVSAEVSPDGTVTFYSYDVNGTLLGLERNGQRYYVIADQVGTPLALLNESGDTVKTWNYDSYGVLLEDSNPDFQLAIGFAGGITDEDTGLLRFGARDYDPASGRWTARDPIFLESGQANLYAYVNNNPVMSNDPCGELCVGGSLYSGIGGGGKVCFDKDGWGVCGETGLGLGGGIDMSPVETVPGTYTSAEISVKVKLGAASISVGHEWKREKGTPCLQGSWKGAVGLGPFEVDLFSPQGSKMSGMPGDMSETAADLIGKSNQDYKENGWNLKNGIEGTAKLTGCKSFKY
ncbi:fibronectin type III domain-containing protein [Cohnella yongneupensis]|uniref:Fibronectin type III domain-containing protein n=1 Tax=Cohnella yongneupensis TaxID=425006 RepID=A0ABW0QWJ5_9BACL